MSIEAVIDQAVIEHLSAYGTISKMDPFAIHMLKNSEHPLMRFRRTWMRKEALRQCLEAHKAQPHMNKALGAIPHQKRANIRQSASVHPWLAEDMRRRHNASFNDKDFVGFVKREEPEMFPRRAE